VDSLISKASTLSSVEAKKKRPGIFNSFLIFFCLSLLTKSNKKLLKKKKEKKRNLGYEVDWHARIYFMAIYHVSKSDTIDSVESLSQDTPPRFYFKSKNFFSFSKSGSLWWEKNGIDVEGKQEIISRGGLSQYWDCPADG
jgi:hypothetical protein